MNSTLDDQNKLLFIKWLNNLQQQDLLLVGGKGANLGKLYDLGYPVPPGFCVSTDAFLYFDKKIGLKAKVFSAMNSLNLDDYQQVRKTSQELGNYIRSFEMPDVIAREIQKGYKILSENKKEPAWVAVRSSAISEDLPKASFAGQLETYLNLHGDKDVVKAVLDCWAALFTERVIHYRGKIGFKQTDVSMGVIVQEMVDATKSGVMFTINPATNDRKKIVIEAIIGLGEALVGGASTPDTYTIDKQTLELIEQQIGSKKRIVLRNPIGGGVIRIKNPEGQGRKPCLTKEEISRLSEFGRRIEIEYNNKPQDIEWAISDNNIYILQTRPVTSL